MIRRTAVVAAFASLLVMPLHGEILEQVLVKINGDILTKSDFEQRQVAELRNRPELANVNPGSLELRKAIAEVTPILILAAVDELLLIQRGRELGYAMGDEQFKTILDDIKKRNNLDDEQKFLAALKQENMTLPDLRRSLERSMLTSQVERVEIMDKISVTEEEAKAYYESNRQQFTTPSELTLREILIEVPTSDRGVNVAQDDEMRAKAEGIRQRLLAGEPFAKLASEFSASASKANGGLIGPINHGELAPALQQMVDAAKIGDVMDVIRTSRGYQVLKLESRTDTRVRTFEDARNDIGNRVAGEKRIGEREKYLERLREQATITWRNDELKKAYEQALAQRRQRSAKA